MYYKMIWRVHWKGLLSHRIANDGHTAEVLQQSGERDFPSHLAADNECTRLIKSESATEAWVVGPIYIQDKVTR